MRMSHQSKIVDGNHIRDIESWITSHNRDYAQVRDRLEYVRNIVLRGRIECAVNILKKSYKFAVMSIQTAKSRHENAFVAHCNGLDLKDACLQTVYGGQKFGWLDKTLSNVDFISLTLSVREKVRNNQYADLLELITNRITGVSYRKGAFMLAMSGLHEYMCIDSNVGRYADTRDSSTDYRNAEHYLDECAKIVQEIDNPYLPAFIIQWAIYDMERGEHSRHMCYFNEILY
jgi:hypothetical protein